MLNSVLHYFHLNIQITQKLKFTATLVVYTEIQKVLLGAAMKEMSYADAYGICLNKTLVSATPPWPDGVLTSANQLTHRYWLSSSQCCTSPFLVATTILSTVQPPPLTMARKPPTHEKWGFTWWKRVTAYPSLFRPTCNAAARSKHGNHFHPSRNCNRFSTFCISA